MKVEWIVAITAATWVCLVPAGGKAQCSTYQIINCAGMRGVPVPRSGACYCDIYEWVPRRAINAQDGDVVIVPIDGRGSDVVATVTREIGQLHRHAVMFWDQGRQTRHNTMYIFDGEDGSVSDPEGDYVELLTPLVGRVRFDGDQLQNGLPGAISQSVDETHARGRLADTGLVLKPALVIDFRSMAFPTSSEPDRPRFEAAVANARFTSGYYKLGDYTDMDSMAKPWSSSRTGDLRGSHCSGYATHFYRQQGFALADVFYPTSLRQHVADVLFDEVRAQCRSSTGFWADLLSIVTGHWSVCSNLANQIVNCFADLSCGDTNDTWRGAIGTGFAVSPDNLLPDSFRYTGTTNYDWDGITLSNQHGTGYAIAGTSVSHPGLAGTEPGVSATSTSPFVRAEALRYSGGYAVLADSVRM